jgi:hypothetical protein
MVTTQFLDENLGFRLTKKRKFNKGFAVSRNGNHPVAALACFFP